jgi:hypothetical protein
MIKSVLHHLLRVPVNIHGLMGNDVSQNVYGNQKSNQQNEAGNERGQTASVAEGAKEKLVKRIKQSGKNS